MKLLGMIYLRLERWPTEMREYTGVVRRWLANAACLLSAMLLVVLLGVWVRSSWRTDVVMMPTGRESVFLFTSHRGGWMELGLFTGWPSPGWGAWTGAGREGDGAGPFKVWAAHRTKAGYGIWMREGQLILPSDASGGSVIVDDAAGEAVQRGYPGMISNGDPGWVMVRGWEIKLPLVYPIALAAMMPMAWLVGWRLGARRRRRRLRAGCCVTCGYDPARVGGGLSGVWGFEGSIAVSGALVATEARVGGI